MKEVGQNIVKMRKERNWTADFLAKKIGISPGYLSKLEKGTKPINLKNLEKFANAFDIDITELLPNKKIVNNPLTGEDDWLFVIEQLKEKGFSPGDVYLKIAQGAIENDKKETKRTLLDTKDSNSTIYPPNLSK